MNYRTRLGGEIPGSRPSFHKLLFMRAFTSCYLTGDSNEGILSLERLLICFNKNKISVRYISLQR